ncbi:WYL domain-containing protein [Fibrobacter sp.]|uniref:WYL domain-containing protein n=1 Tax=Fibrobacter sp. TaxID=35828 RepID=UPI00261FECF6|nr:WYL domain-containing protein [Fibrobacter sp.]MDD7497960.1 WYL domain-containing protein [Fibrobacter sp.]MDY5725262.1 WYL domain-containing protein [Fibrobacter sp.]
MINVSQKIKVAVSHLLRSQMELDVEDYGLKSLSDLCNRILARYAEFAPPDPTRIGADDTLYKNVPPLQFSLNQAGESFANFANSFTKNAGTKIATLCRYYFECYVNMPRGKRECFIFRDELDKLNAAAESRTNVSLTYRGERKCVSPCFLAFSPSQVRAYVVVCDDKVECAAAGARFHSLRLCHIRGVAPDTASKAFHCENFELSHQAEVFREHFDPFLCYGQQVKVKLTEEGARRYNKLTTNRPKVIAKERTDVDDTATATSCNNKMPAGNNARPDCAEVNGAGTYTFECSEKLAKVYFPQFLSDADILEPRELRLWFKEEFEKAAVVYKGI